MNVYKKLLSIVLVAIMVLSLVPFSVFASEEMTGIGTEADPYVIMTADQLMAFAEEVNSGNDFEGEYIILGADIDLEGYDWEPIGNTAELVPATADEEAVYAEFCGTFDGKGYTISNIYLDRNDEYEPSGFLGLFGGVFGGVVKNVTVADSYFNGENSVGSIVALAIEGAVIENCVSKNNTVTGTYDVGGVVGYAYEATIKRCSNYSNVLSEGDNGGGIVAYAEKTDITDCINIGYIEGDDDMGGIAGAIYGCNVKNCANLGNVYCYDEDCGGIVGYADVYSDIVIMYVDSASEDSGVIYNYIDNCYNGGNIKADDDETGGIVGDATGAYITNCYNKGNVALGGQNAGGIIGEITDSVVGNCFNTGDIEANDHIGGIVGNIDNDELYDTEMPDFSELIYGSYYTEGSAEFALGTYQYTNADGYVEYVDISEEVGDNAAIAKEDMLDAESYPELDFDKYWEMGAKGPQLKYFHEVYRMYIPAGGNNGFENGEIVLDGTVKVLGVELQDGEYLANGAAEPTTEAPSVGYAYFKNNKLYLNNFYYSGEGALYGVARYVILTYGSIEIVLVGESTIDFEVGAYSQMPVPVAHMDNSNYDGFTVVYSGAGTLNLTSDSVGIQAHGDIIFEGGNFNINSYESAIYAGSLVFRGGRFDIETDSYDSDSVFALENIDILGGVFDINSNEDAIYSDDTIYIYDGEFNINAEYNGIFAYYDMVIYDGVFDIESYGDALVADYYDLYIYGGDYNLTTGDDGVYACETVYIENATMVIYADDCGLESCCGCDIIIQNSLVNIEAYCAIDSDANTEIIDSDVTVYGYYGISSQYETVIQNSVVNCEYCYMGINSDYGNVMVQDSELVINSEYGINAGNEVDLYSVYFDNSEVKINAYGAIFAGYVYFNGGRTDVVAEDVFECIQVYFNDGSHTFEALSVMGESEYYVDEEVLSEAWEISEDVDNYYEILYIRVANAATPGQVPPEELPEEDDSLGEPVDDIIIYVGGVEMQDGDYLASGGSNVMSKAPSRGGYAYYKDGVLTLNNYKYYGEGIQFFVNSNFDINSLILSETDMEIVLVGDNVISNTASIGDGITVMGNLAISGDGKLDITATEGIYSYGESVVIDAVLNIDAENIGITATEVDVDGGVLTVKGSPAFDAAVVLGENMEYTKGDAKADDVVIEYVEPKQPETPDKPEDPDNPNPPEEPKGLRGDINANGKIDMTDYILLKRVYFGTFDLTDEELGFADVNANGKVDMTDYILLKRVYFETFTISEENKYVY